jgi:hypothetical protein
MAEVKETNGVEFTFCVRFLLTLLSVASPNSTAKLYLKVHCLSIDPMAKRGKMGQLD